MDVVKYKESLNLQWGLNPMSSALIRRDMVTETLERGNVKTKAAMGGTDV